VGPGLAQRLEEVERRIAGACKRAGRRREEITLVAVTKTFPAEMILQAYGLGLRDFGENYVQEAQSRWPELRTRFPDVELHLVGALQTNKARVAVALFDVIQTLDRPSLARALAKELGRPDARTRRLLVEVNLAEEPQKAGLPPGELASFLGLCRDELKLPVTGLMAIPPAEEDVAPYAALLAKLAGRHGLAEVSVGMSADFETAIAFGATIVRVGTAIFGERAARPRPAAQGSTARSS